MSIAPQNEAPTWRGITDVQSVVSGLMAADRGAELGIAVPASDSDSQSPADDAQGVESDDPAPDDDSDSDVSLAADDDASAADQVEAETAEQSLEEDGSGPDLASDVAPSDIDVESFAADTVNEAGDAPSDSENVEGPGDAQDSASDADVGEESEGLLDETEQVEPGPEVPLSTDEIEEAGGADLGAEETGALELPEGATDDTAPVDDPGGESDGSPDDPSVSSMADDAPEGVMSGIEFESSISPVPFEWKPEDNSPGGWDDAVQVPDQLSLPISDVGGYAQTDRTQGY